MTRVIIITPCTSRASSPRLELECTSAVSTPFATHLTYRRA
jgi:hypothetical protein